MTYGLGVGYLGASGARYIVHNVHLCSNLAEIPNVCAFLFVLSVCLCLPVHQAWGEGPVVRVQWTVVCGVGGGDLGPAPSTVRRAARVQPQRCCGGWRRLLLR